jgi:cold shock CspA family protein
MYGLITKFRDDLGIGVITAEDGRKYRFANTALIAAARPRIGEEVDFLLIARRPSQIVVLTGSTWTAFSDICSRAANDRE